MTQLVDPERIEEIVGWNRHPILHHARADSAGEMVYLLHSAECVEATDDLRECPFSKALDLGIELETWTVDAPMVVAIDQDTGLLVPLGGAL